MSKWNIASFSKEEQDKVSVDKAAAATTGISVRSGRRIEKGQWQSSGERHWLRPGTALRSTEKKSIFAPDVPGWHHAG